ncbi:hypothetical protein PQQ64_07950 [Paraburkholderia graminis]
MNALTTGCKQLKEVTLIGRRHRCAQMGRSLRFSQANQRVRNEVTTVGVDITKNVFQLHWVDGESGEIVSKPLKPAVFFEHAANRETYREEDLGVDARSCQASGRADFGREKPSCGKPRHPAPEPVPVARFRDSVTCSKIFSKFTFLEQDSLEKNPDKTKAWRGASSRNFNHG